MSPKRIICVDMRLLESDGIMGHYNQWISPLTNSKLTLLLGGGAELEDLGSWRHDFGGCASRSCSFLLSLFFLATMCQAAFSHYTLSCCFCTGSSQPSTKTSETVSQIKLSSGKLRVSGIFSQGWKSNYIDTDFVSLRSILPSGISGAYSNSISNLLRTPILFSMMILLISISPQQYVRVLLSLYSLQPFLCFVLIDNSHPYRYEVISHCGFNLQSQMMSEYEHVFSYLLAVCKSSLEKCLFKFFTNL